MSLFDLFNEAETRKEPFAGEPEESTLIPEHKRKKGKRGSKLATLPVETIEYQLEENEKVCSQCGCALTEMKKEIRRELKIIPAQIRVVEHVTAVYCCRTCEKEGTKGFILNAESPKALLQKSMVSPVFWHIS